MFFDRLSPSLSIQSKLRPRLAAVLALRLAICCLLAPGLSPQRNGVLLGRDDAAGFRPRGPDGFSITRGTGNQAPSSLTSTHPFGPSDQRRRTIGQPVRTPRVLARHLEAGRRCEASGGGGEAQLSAGRIQVNLCWQRAPRAQRRRGRPAPIEGPGAACDEHRAVSTRPPPGRLSARSPARWSESMPPPG